MLNVSELKFKHKPALALGLCPQLLLLLLSHFSHLLLCATTETAAHQAPPSLGFSRQEHWSGLPFPSPVHESEKWKWSRSVMSDSLRPHELQPTRLLHPWDLPGKSTGVGCHRLLRSSVTTSYFFWRLSNTRYPETAITFHLALGVSFTQQVRQVHE